jgi:hypothetical protein
MYTKDDVEKDGDKVSFKPNLITYSASKNSPAGKQVSKSKIGVVVHTKYEGNSLEDMNATPDVDHNKFQQHPDVHLINPDIKNPPHEYDEKLQNQFHGHMSKARDAGKNLNSDDYKAVEGHETNLEAHINDMIKNEDRPSVGGYVAHLERKRDRDVEKLKSDAGKNKTSDRYNGLIDHVKKDADSFKKFLDFHPHSQNAKTALVKGMGNPTEFEHTINGEKTDPEGFVSVRGGKMSKLTNRIEFNRKNFLARPR